MLNEDFGKSLVVFIGWMLFRKKFPKTLLTPPMPALPRCAAGQAWDWDAPLLASRRKKCGVCRAGRIIAAAL